MPKMMLPATQTSCLKDSHTNFQSDVGISITYFGERLQFVCKNQRWKYQIYLFKIWSYKIVFVCRNQYEIVLEANRVCMPKMMLPATQTKLFEGQSYKFRKLRRNWYKILWRLLEFVCQKMMLPAISNSCLKYSYKFLNQSRNWYLIH